MSILKQPDLSDPMLREKLKKGMGHNYYGEPAWPNDLLYVFPIVIMGTIACCVALAVLDPALIGEPANPFATPLEILPEWYLYPVFQVLRSLPNKLLGIIRNKAKLLQASKDFAIILIKQLLMPDYGEKGSWSPTRPPQ